MKTTILTSIVGIMLCGCSDSNPNDQVETGQSKSVNSEANHKMPLPADVGKIYSVGGRKYLFAGDDSASHFDITNCELNDRQYHYGIGREAFDALIQPEYITQSAADKIYSDTARFLYLDIKGEKRAYSIELLTHHEVINDVVAGQPIMAAYCVLADLGAIYHRQYNDQVLTFALSGYTYYDPEVWDGTDGFVFWDRETESTWWPLIGKGVSGPLNDVPLNVYNEDNWKETTWGKIMKNETNVLVLKEGQSMEAPSDWPHYSEAEITAIITDPNPMVGTP